MKLGYLITHLRISDNQCNGATHTHAVMTWLREQAGDFYDAGIKKLVPRLTKCIAIYGDYVEKLIKVCCKSATSE
jgi:hypothetical protein